ncbi:MAG: hypothetical protein AAF961_19945, partial [Planctomycetota bacterium]
AAAASAEAEQPNGDGDASSEADAIDESTSDESNSDELNRGESKADESKPGSLPDDLLLAVAAIHLDTDEIGDEPPVALLQQAVAAAEAIEQPSLAGSLRCQIAKRIAKNDPDRARTMFLSTLDHLLPPAERSTTNSAEVTP